MLKTKTPGPCFLPQEDGGIVGERWRRVKPLTVDRTSETARFDHVMSDRLLPEGQSSDVADASVTNPIADTVTRAAFLVTHWLVGEGER
jgi:hypothetical protein